MRGGARNLVNNWEEGSDLEDLYDFEPMPTHPTPDTLPETVIRKTHNKRIDQMRNTRRASKESTLNEADEGARSSA